MRKLISHMHISLDAFACSESHDFDWIKVDEEIFDHGHHHIAAADVAFFGRNTFALMESYWPTAANKPDASKHDREHSQWYKQVTKYVFSNTLQQSEISNATILTGNIEEQVINIKKQPGGNIIILGSPGLVHSLQKLNLIDEYLLNINPVILGNGTRMFDACVDRTKLTLLDSNQFKCGVVNVRYRVEK